MWHSGQPYKVLPSSAVVSRISPGFGRGFFSFDAFFFFFFLVGVAVVAVAVAAVVAVAEVREEALLLEFDVLWMPFDPFVPLFKLCDWFTLFPEFDPFVWELWTCEIEICCWCVCACDCDCVWIDCIWCCCGWLRIDNPKFCVCDKSIFWKSKPFYATRNYWYV